MRVSFAGAGLAGSPRGPQSVLGVVVEQRQTHRYRSVGPIRWLRVRTWRSGIAVGARSGAMKLSAPMIRLEVDDETHSGESIMK